MAGNCKAYGQTSSKYHKRNHLANVCMSKQKENWRNKSKKQEEKDKQDVRQLGDNSENLRK